MARAAAIVSAAIGLPRFDLVNSVGMIRLDALAGDDDSQCNRTAAKFPGAIKGQWVEDGLKRPKARASKARGPGAAGRGTWMIR
jgi:hypothetical protein